MGSLKIMAPVFSAFDRINYRRIIPQHIADCLLLPSDIKAAFLKGGFAVSILGNEWHSVAIDECHEMLINRDLKDAVTRPGKSSINQVALSFPYKSRNLRNIRNLVFDKEPVSNSNMSSIEKKMNENVVAILSGIRSSAILPSLVSAPSSLQLRNSFTGLIATYEQQHDLLNFRSIGQDDFDNLVKQTYLKEKKSKHKKHNLKTLTPTKITKRRFVQVEKEKKLVTECLKKRLLSMEVSGMPLKEAEQFLELPRAIATKEGLPHKGQKSSITKFYEKKYEEAFLLEFPLGWVPHLVILEGMFLINAIPIRVHSKMSEYALYLFERFLGKYLQVGVCELHVLFDSPGTFTWHPKNIERERRDGTIGIDHEHLEFSDEMKIPSKWRDIISCRVCKYKFIDYLGLKFLELGPTFLRGDQKLFVAGGTNRTDQNLCWSTTKDGLEEVAIAFTTNAEEADTRIWLHVKSCYGSRVLIFSPDTDVYHIGLLQMHAEHEILVQYNTLGSDLKLVALNTLSECLQNEPELRQVDKPLRNKIIVTLYALSGCDFTSFFVGITKTSFAKTLLNYAEFITGDTKVAPGTLASHSPAGNGFLACLRLVASAYMVKHKQAFSSNTPPALYLSFESESIMERHKRFYNHVKEQIWTRVTFEDDLPPSFEALQRHWLRSIWVLNYWEQSYHNDVTLLPVNYFGWSINEDKITVDWESNENVMAIRKRVSFLTKGCGYEGNDTEEDFISMADRQLEDATNEDTDDTDEDEIDYFDITDELIEEDAEYAMN
uniref:Uncharacterized protein n=1 Tax=Amphimedon queenslandica TaxID=400682 RepID=A0A1X7VCY4_AMPQE